MTSLGWVGSLTDVAISIEKIPFPSSYSRTEDAAGATLLNRCAPGVERVIGARLFAEGSAAADTQALGASKAMAAGFFRSTGAVAPCVDGAKTISLRTGAARAPSVTTAPDVGDVHLLRGDSTIPNDACRKLTPRICAQTFPCSSHRSISSLTLRSAA